MAAARNNQLRHVSSAVALVACLCDKENVNNWHENYLNLGVVQIRLTSCHAETGAFHSHRLKSTFSSAVEAGDELRCLMCGKRGFSILSVRSEGVRGRKSDWQRKRD